MTLKVAVPRHNWAQHVFADLFRSLPFDYTFVKVPKGDHWHRVAKDTIGGKYDFTIPHRLYSGSIDQLSFLTPTRIVVRSVGFLFNKSILGRYTHFYWLRGFSNELWAMVFLFWGLLRSTKLILVRPSYRVVLFLNESLLSLILITAISARLLNFHVSQTTVPLRDPKGAVNALLGQHRMTLLSYKHQKRHLLRILPPAARNEIMAALRVAPGLKVSSKWQALRMIKLNHKYFTIANVEYRFADLVHGRSRFVASEIAGSQKPLIMTTLFVSKRIPHCVINLINQRISQLWEIGNPQVVRLVKFWHSLPLTSVNTSTRPMVVSDFKLIFLAWTIAIVFSAVLGAISRLRRSNKVVSWASSRAV